MQEEFIIEDFYKSARPVKPIKYKLGGNNGDCYICTSHAKNPNGYYKIKRNGKNYDLHLWIYNVYHGQIDKGMVVRHICGNRDCINPYHMTYGTYSDNAYDMVYAQTQKRFLTEIEVREIKRLLKEAKLKQYEIAHIFDIYPSQVSKINNNIIWSNVIL